MTSVTIDPGTCKPLDAILSDLRTRLSDAERELEGRLREVAEQRSSIERLRAVVDALASDDDSSPPDDDVAAPSPVRPTRRRSSARASYIRPKQKTLDLTFAALLAADEPQNQTQMIERLRDELSHSTVRRALLALRDDGRTRIVATTRGRGGSTYYAPMPEELADDAR
jgi:DNA-binding transcriptional ArsR family regulator